MKKTLLYFLALAVMAGCSAPKYSYNFDYYNYHAGKKKALAEKEVAANPGVEIVKPETLTASLESEPLIVNEPPVVAEKESPAPVKKTYMQMTKTERKALRQYIKSEVKASAKGKNKTESVQSVSSTQAMDKDLRLAAIFGAVGLVALIIGGDVFWVIGGIAMLIGVVFFVKWLVRQ